MKGEAGAEWAPAGTSCAAHLPASWVTMRSTRPSECQCRAPPGTWQPARRSLSGEARRKGGVDPRDPRSQFLGRLPAALGRTASLFCTWRFLRRLRTSFLKAAAPSSTCPNFMPCTAFLADSWSLFWVSAGCHLLQEAFLIPSMLAYLCLSLGSQRRPCSVVHFHRELIALWNGRVNGELSRQEPGACGQEIVAAAEPGARGCRGGLRVFARAAWTVCPRCSGRGTPGSACAAGITSWCSTPRCCTGKWRGPSSSQGTITT